MRFQTVHRVNIDFEATYEKLKQLGYNPQIERAGRKPQIEAGNLTFDLKSGAKVNIFPKGKYNAIQVAWNNIEEMRKQERKLLNTLLVFPSAYAKALSSVDFFRSKHMVINLRIPYDDKLLRKIDAAYSEYMREKANFKSILDRLFR